MADSLQVTVINETDINYIWLSVRQPQKDRQKIQPLPTVITHIHINQAELHFWSVVWKSLFYDSSSRQILFFVVLPHQSRKKKWCKRKKGTTTRVYVCASVCVCGWVDVWPLSRASSPAPHVTHLLGPNVDQDRKTIKKKKKKRCFLLWATLTLPTTEEHRVGCFWDFVFLSFVIFRGNFTTTHTHTHTHTQATLCGSGLSGHLRPILARDIIAYVMIFISPCSSPHRADICVDKPSVREFTQL